MSHKNFVAVPAKDLTANIKAVSKSIDTFGLMAESALVVAYGGNGQLTPILEIAKASGKLASKTKAMLEAYFIYHGIDINAKKRVIATNRPMETAQDEKGNLVVSLPVSITIPQGAERLDSLEAASEFLRKNGKSFKDFAKDYDAIAKSIKAAKDAAKAAKAEAEAELLGESLQAENSEGGELPPEQSGLQKLAELVRQLQAQGVSPEAMHNVIDSLAEAEAEA